VITYCEVAEDNDVEIKDEDEEEEDEDAMLRMPPPPPWWRCDAGPRIRLKELSDDE
jgi:hypothetical protein